MSKAIHTLLNENNHATHPGLDGIERSFPMDEAVIERESVFGLVEKSSNRLIRQTCLKEQKSSGLKHTGIRLGPSQAA